MNTLGEGTDISDVLNPLSDKKRDPQDSPSSRMSVAMSTGRMAIPTGGGSPRMSVAASSPRMSTLGGGTPRGSMFSRRLSIGASLNRSLNRMSLSSAQNTLANSGSGDANKRLSCVVDPGRMKPQWVMRDVESSHAKPSEEGGVTDNDWHYYMDYFFMALEKLYKALEVPPAPRAYRALNGYVPGPRDYSSRVEDDVPMFDWRILRMCMRITREQICVYRFSFRMSESVCTIADLLVYQFRGMLWQFEQFAPTAANGKRRERMRMELHLFDKIYCQAEQRLFAEVITHFISQLFSTRKK